MVRKSGLVCNSINTTITFTIETCGETQSDPLNCKNKLYLWKCKVFVKLHTLEKAELNSDIDLIIVKVKTELLQRKIEKFHRNFFS